MSGYNLRVIQREIIAQAKRPIEARANDVIERRLEKVKTKMLEDFDNSPVTKEIEEGAYGDGSLPNGGNLFAFLGFYKSEKPIAKLRQFLKRSVKARKETKFSIKGDKIIVSKTIETPTLQSAFDAAQSDGVEEWSPDKSWLQLIEDGIPNFAKFIIPQKKAFESPPSRSTTGLQVENNVRSTSGSAIGGVRYISEIFAKLRARISGNSS